MKITKDKYWVRIENVPYPSDGGMWVIYTKSQKKLEDLTDQVSRFVKKYCLIGASIRVDSVNIFTIETSIDRFEVLAVKKLIQKYFRKIIKDVIWKAGFESIDDWSNAEFPKGELWYIGKLETLAERVFQLIKKNRLDKALRMQTEIWRIGSEMRHSMLLSKVEKRRKMIIEPVFGNISYEIHPSKIFVIMPFNEKWSDSTYSILSDASNENNLELIRADNIFSPGSVIQDIWKLINSCGLIIADISIHNPNVFYELGIAHTLGKKVLLIKQNGSERSPFDIGFWRYFEYEISYEKAKEFKVALNRLFLNYKNENGI